MKVLELAKREERTAIEEFGDEYRRYMASTPAWFPKFNTSEIASND